MRFEMVDREIVTTYGVDSWTVTSVGGARYDVAEVEIRESKDPGSYEVSVRMQGYRLKKDGSRAWSTPGSIVATIEDDERALAVHRDFLRRGTAG